jgi:hypothetical protein
MRNKFSIFLFASTFVLSGCYSSKYYQVNSQKLLGIEWKLMYVKSAQSSSLLIPTGDKIPFHGRCKVEWGQARFWANCWRQNVLHGWNGN